jgi:hypothetical protein
MRVLDLFLGTMYYCHTDLYHSNQVCRHTLIVHSLHGQDMDNFLLSLDNHYQISCYSSMPKLLAQRNPR